eukprot:6621066-Pyramimonas_sp.AAC.1
MAFYGVSGAGPTQPNIDLLDQIGEIILQCDSPWIIQGGFNLTPAELDSTGWLTEVKGVIVAPDVATCAPGRGDGAPDGGRVLDYVIIAETLAPCVERVGAFADAPLSHRIPVMSSLKGVRPSTWVSKPVCFRRFAVDLPRGPHLEHAPPDWAWDLPEDAGGGGGCDIPLVAKLKEWYDKSEEFLVGLHGVEQ